MDERLFARLAALLPQEPVVLAHVVDTRGATPRKGGSRMLVAARHTEFSVGGGEAEARVIAQARVLLADARPHAALAIDLSGRSGAAGVCGGSMQLTLRRWSGTDDAVHAVAVAARLAAGVSVALSERELGDGAQASVARPDVRLLIVGGGHCALALYELARHLEFDLWVYDSRRECFDAGQFADATRLAGEPDELARALDTPRDVYAVLLNRDFASDVAALRVLCRRSPRFLGMMGSRKRIGEVVAALPTHAAALTALRAPIGLEIDAQTPHEIAVSILAELVQERRRNEG